MGFFAGAVGLGGLVCCFVYLGFFFFFLQKED